MPPGALLMDGYARWHGSLPVTSWGTGKVYRIGRSGTEIETVARVVSARDNPANPDDPPKSISTVLGASYFCPLFNAGQLVILPLLD